MNKNFKKAVISSLVLPLTLMCSITLVNASTINPQPNNAIFEELIYETNNGTYTFASIEDKESFIISKNLEKEGISTCSDVQTTSTEKSRKTTTNGWISFLTDAWSYHQNFTYSKNQSFSATLSDSYNNVGFSITASKTFSFGGTIAADKTRLSRLGIWQTYTVITYHAVTTGGYGAYVINSFDYNYTSLKGSPIVNAAYKSAPHKYGVAWS